MKKNLALLILSIFWIPIFSGCWGANELDTLGIVTATGLDIENDEIVATFEVIKLNPSSKSSSPSGPENANIFRLGVRLYLKLLEMQA